MLLQGCLNYLTKTMKEQLLLICGTGFALALVQLFGIAFSVCLYTKWREFSELRPVHSKNSQRKDDSAAHFFCPVGQEEEQAISSRLDLIGNGVCNREGAAVEQSRWCDEGQGPETMSRRKPMSGRALEYEGRRPRRCREEEADERPSTGM
ncbi:unnamed protein product [Gongylonema pulchrum]|uniref:Uncharacterized protein n=1 Tax=Gongylonema pulchrum TaxID=637853 RepID=A0A183D508_9BILA|nr:unnamed protein product [Gongylonema pulchrum]